MSSISIFGFFGLATGRRVASQKPGASTKSYHCFYTTALQCSSGVALPAELRVYSPFNDSVLADNTVAFVVAKAHFPRNESVLLEASHIVPLPGDPSSDEYDNNLPDSPYPFIIGLGSVPSRFETLSDGVSKAFNVVSSEFVRDGLKTSSLQCIFDGSRPRWSRTPTPNVNSTIQYFGSFAGVTQDGIPRVTLDSIILNVGHNEPSTAATAPTPIKKWKFAAFAAPIAGDALSSASSSHTAGSESALAPLQASPLPATPVTIPYESRREAQPFASSSQHGYPPTPLIPLRVTPSSPSPQLNPLTFTPSPLSAITASPPVDTVSQTATLPPFTLTGTVSAPPHLRPRCPLLPTLTMQPPPSLRPPCPPMPIHIYCLLPVLETWMT